MDDQDLIDTLVARGYSRADAERLVAFVPIAFGRVIIAHMADVTFSTDYNVVETGKTCSLSDEPVFVESLKLATDSYHKGTLSREAFSACAGRSPELMAVNDALNAGAPLMAHVFGLWSCPDTTHLVKRAGTAPDAMRLVSPQEWARERRQERQQKGKSVLVFLLSHRCSFNTRAGNIPKQVGLLHASRSVYSRFLGALPVGADRLVASWYKAAARVSGDGRTWHYTGILAHKPLFPGVKNND